MPNKSSLLLVVVCTSVMGACASGSGVTVATVVPMSPADMGIAPQAAPTPIDPVDVLIATSDERFALGQRELTLGHLDRARLEFDRALDSLLESPDGAGADPRLREHFNRLVDRISVLEQAALATGDGFTETRTEPAPIDALLAIETFEATAPRLVTAETVRADLEATGHDIPIPTNDRVLRYVELFQGRLKDFLEEGLSRATQYLPMIQDTFRAEGLPLDLAYIPLIESAFKPTALSRAKARGVWQFMHGTALENGLKADWYLDERADPKKSTLAAAKYLKTLFGMFEDWHLAMASYNGGPGRVKRALTKSRKTDFWTLSDSAGFLPRETRDYVPMILAAVIIAKNPVQYGFNIRQMPPVAAEIVTVPPALDLRRVADWASVSVDDLQRLNPEFRRWTTPIKAGEYALKVPHGTAARVQAGLAASAPTQLNALQWHTVKRGETLSSIAKTLRVSRADLAEANYLRTTSKVPTGRRLLVPRMPSAALLARAVASPTALTDAVLASAIVEEPTVRIYRVRSGDTLSAIARRHGTTVARLQAWNRMRGTKLQIGDRLVVQDPRGAAANGQQ